MSNIKMTSLIDQGELGSKQMVSNKNRITARCLIGIASIACLICINANFIYKSNLPTKSADSTIADISLESSIIQEGHKEGKHDYGEGRYLQQIESNAVEERKSAFICITGQLGRLELENKMRNIIKPMRQNGYHISVAIVMSKGKPIFTHSAAKEERYDHLRKAIEYLRSLPYVRVLNPAWTAYYPIKNPNPPAVYYVGLKKHDRGKLEEVFERAENHVRMFDSYQRCWDIERKDALTQYPEVELLPPAHDVYIRIRDDVGLTKPLNMTMVNQFRTFSQSKWNPKIMITSDCRTWGGINDRMAIISPAAAQEYFLNPYQALAVDPYRGFGKSGKNKIDWDKVSNTEGLLKSLYEASDIHIIQSEYLRGVNRIVLKKEGNELIDAFHHADNTAAFCPDDTH